MRNQIMLRKYFGLALTVSLINLVGFGQSPVKKDWRDVEAKTVTLFSRAKHKDESDGYNKSTFSLRYGVRSDEGLAKTNNNYELQYGGISLDGDSDWFQVTMVTDDCSRIKDLGQLGWTEIFEVPILTASIEAHKGIRFPGEAETFEKSSDGQVTKVASGHMYVVHSKDSGSDFYTLFRVEELIPYDQVTISWKRVPSPEKLK